ncbi:WD repeat-containing and planar cell polarity effector protein [Pelomyxa schiedti]|nr:WD repeat-containing and planar cell polarity effector protein [Pelomyxa schiedti]
MLSVQVLVVSLKQPVAHVPVDAPARSRCGLVTSRHQPRNSDTSLAASAATPPTTEKTPRSTTTTSGANGESTSADAVNNAQGAQFVVRSYFGGNRESPPSPANNYRPSLLSYWEGVGRMTLLPNEKPDKPRESLKEVEDILFVSPPISLRWPASGFLQILTQNGNFITAKLSEVYHQDITTLHIRKLFSKIVGAHAISSGFILQNYATLATETTLFTIVAKKTPLSDVKSQSDVSIYELPLSGAPVSIHVALKTGLIVVMLAYKFSFIIYASFYEGKVSFDYKKQYEYHCPRASCIGYSTVIDTTSLRIIEIPTDVDTRPLDPSTASVSTGLVAISNFVISRASNNVLHLVKETVGEFPSPGSALTAALDYSGQYCVVAHTDRSITLFNRRINAVHTANSNEGHQEDRCIVRWHSSSAFFAVCYGSGTVSFFDTGLSPLSIQTEFGICTCTLNLVPHIGYYAPLSVAEWEPRSLKPADKRDDSDLLVILYNRGPIILLRLELGVGAVITQQSVLSYYISSREFAKAVQVVRAMASEEEYWNGVGSLVKYITRHYSYSEGLEELHRLLCESAIPKTDVLPAPPALATCRSTITIFVHLLLRLGHYQFAFQLAAKAPHADSVWRDIVAWCDQVSEPDVAGAARLCGGQPERFITSNGNSGNATSRTQRGNNSSRVATPRSSTTAELRNSSTPSDAKAKDDAEITALIEAEHRGVALTQDQASRLGIYHESEGQHSQAHALYLKYELDREAKRLQSVLQTH